MIYVREWPRGKAKQGRFGTRPRTDIEPSSSGMLYSTPAERFVGLPNSGASSLLQGPARSFTKLDPTSSSIQEAAFTVSPILLKSCRLESIYEISQTYRPPRSFRFRHVRVAQSPGAALAWK